MPIWEISKVSLFFRLGICNLLLRGRSPESPNFTKSQLEICYRKNDLSFHPTLQIVNPGFLPKKEILENAQLYELSICDFHPDKRSLESSNFVDSESVIYCRKRDLRNPVTLQICNLKYPLGNEISRSTQLYNFRICNLSRDKRFPKWLLFITSQSVICHQGEILKSA